MRKHIFMHFSLTSLLLWQSVLHNIILIIFKALLLCYVFVFVFEDHQRVKSMKNTCGWGPQQVKFKIHVLKPCWVFGLLRNVTSSILLEFIEFVYALLFLAVYREYFIITCHWSFIYSFTSNNEVLKPETKSSVCCSSHLFTL